MHKNFKMKLFIKLYIYYVCVFVIPFTIISVFLMQCVMSQYNNDVVSLFMNITDHISSVMDTDLYSAEKAAYTLKKSSAVLQLASEESFSSIESIYSQKKLADELAIFQSNQNSTSSVHIFYSSSQMIFTSTNKYTFDEYYDRLFHNSKHTPEEISYMLNSGKTFYLSSQSEDPTADAVIAIISPLFVDAKGNCITLITNIGTSSIFATYSTITKNLSESYFSIASDSNTVMISSRDLPEKIALNELLSSPSNRIVDTGENYLALKSNSVIKDLNYVYVFSKSEILEKSNRTANILKLLIAVIAVVLLFIAYIISCRSFSPVSAIIANSKEKDTLLKLDSYDNIKNLVSDIINTNNSLRVSVENQKQCINDNLFKMFLQNSMDIDEKTINMLFGDRSEELCSTYFNTAIVNVMDFADIQADAANLLIINIIRSNVEAINAHAILIPCDTNSIIFMITHNTNTSKLKEALDNAYGAITSNSNISVCICIGKQIESIALFSKSYEDAMCCMYVKKAGVFMGSEKALSANTVFFSHSDKTHLINFVASGNRSAVYDFFDNFMTEIFIKNALTYDILSSLRYALSDTLNEIIYSQNDSSVLKLAEQNTALQSGTDYIQSFKSIADLFLLTTDTLLESKKCGSENLKMIIRGYVNTNYYRPDISLKLMAEELHYSDSYLYKFFKNEMGTVFLDYLHNVRFENAKKLLIETNKSITEISYAVGYLSANTFTKTFKKFNGITPGQFRKNHRKA